MSFGAAKKSAEGAARMGASLFEEFKNFAFRGNVVDLAIGVIIGAAFGNIVKSLTDNLIMPLLSYVTPKMDFSEWMIGRIKFGNFLNDLLSFLITALAIYLFIVKFLGWVMRTRRESPPEPTAQEKLLMEIRDELRTLNRSGSTSAGDRQ
jgi:large conductance mechanosensitive channel